MKFIGPYKPYRKSWGRSTIPLERLRFGEACLLHHKSVSGLGLHTLRACRDREVVSAWRSFGRIGPDRDPYLLNGPSRLTDPKTNRNHEQAALLIH